MDTDITINLSDLLKSLLKKWKQIIAIALAFAVLGGGYGAYKTVKDRNRTIEFIQENSLTQDYYTFEVAKLAKDLIPAENPMDTSAIYKVEDAVRSYNSYNQQIADIQSKIENSLYFRLNPEAVPTLQRMYYINVAGGEWDNPVIDRLVANIVNLYKAQLTSDAAVQKVISELGWDTTPAYFREILSIYQSTDLLNITILGNSQEECKKVADLYDQIVTEVTPEVKKAIPGYEFSLTDAGDSYTEPKGDDIVRGVNEAYLQIDKINNDIVNLTKNFSAGQKAMFNEAIATEYILANGGAEELSRRHEGEGLRAAIKMAIIGAVLGGCLMCGIYVIQYLTSKKLHTPEDIGELFGLVNIGSVENLRTLIEKKQMQKVAVLGVAADECGFSSVSLDQADAAVFAEKINCSEIQEISEQIQQCNLYGVPVLGYIIVR